MISILSHITYSIWYYFFSVLIIDDFFSFLQYSWFEGWSIFVCNGRSVPWLRIGKRFGSQSICVVQNNGQLVICIKKSFFCLHSHQMQWRQVTERIFLLLNKQWGHNIHSVVWISYLANKSSPSLTRMTTGKLRHLITM